MELKRKMGMLFGLNKGDFIVHSHLSVVCPSTLLRVTCSQQFLSEKLRIERCLWKM